ncbi:MAG: GIDE domain-containing protein [Phycisphaeraceae bacterium]
MFYAIGGIVLVIGLIVLLVGISKGKLLATMTQMPTSDIGKLQGGSHVEIKGIADADAPLTAPGSDIACVYYEYEVQRRERVRDSDGKEKEEWRTIDSGTSGSTFVVTDATGSVNVEPRGAKMDCPVVADRYLNERDSGGGVMGSILGALASFTPNREKIRTRAIAVGQALYILGNVVADGGSLRVTKGAGKFFISTRSEEQLTGSLGWQSKLMKAIGAVMLAGGATLIILAAMGVVGKQV